MLKRPPLAGGVAKDAAPAPPWCAVRLYPALNLDLDAARWLGDLERIVAWGWIDR